STPCPKFKDTIRVSKWLQMLLNAGTAPWPRIPGMSGGAAGDGGLASVLKIAKEHGVTRRSTRRIPWGKLVIDSPPRNHRVAGYLGRRNRASDEGTNPRYAHRLLIDGRVFKRHRKGRG